MHIKPLLRAVQNVCIIPGVVQGLRAVPGGLSPKALCSTLCCPQPPQAGPHVRPLHLLFPLPAMRFPQIPQGKLLYPPAASALCPSSEEPSPLTCHPSALLWFPSSHLLIFQFLCNHLSPHTLPPREWGFHEGGGLVLFLAKDLAQCLAQRKHGG